MVEDIIKYEIIVAGGGIAGISAAIKASSMGAKVLLVEQYDFLGGMSTAGMVSPFMKHSVNGRSLVRGVFEAIENEMRRMNGMIDNGFYAGSFRLSAYKLIKSAGCDVLFNGQICGVDIYNGIMNSVDVLLGRRRVRIKGQIFIDTTGDAQLLFLGNLPYSKGEESTGKLQTLTMFFRMANIDMQKAAEYIVNHKDNFFGWMDYNFDFAKIISVAGYFSQVKNAIEQGRLSPEIGYIFFTTLPGDGEASFNTTNILDFDGSVSSDLTKAELIGREQVSQVVRLLQEEIAGFENSFLLETAVQVGVRETRRAIGDYVFTGEDVRCGKKFDDSIAKACYGIDIHGQKDEKSVMEYLDEGQFYEVPLRTLFVKDTQNVLAAGRCISSTREGHSALRIMPTSSATGEACGAAAALALKSGKKLRELNIKEIQKSVFYNLEAK